MQRLLMISALVLSAWVSAAETEDSPPLINLTFGQVGIERHVENPWRYGIEYRLRPFGEYRLVPSLGFAWVENGANYLYGELRRDFAFPSGVLLTPSFGLGAFDGSSEFRLGKTLEFRTGIEIAYRFPGRYRLGLALFHMSNGGLGKENPGAEALVLSFSAPIR